MKKYILFSIFVQCYGHLCYPGTSQNRGYPVPGIEFNFAGIPRNTQCTGFLKELPQLSLIQVQRIAAAEMHDFIVQFVFTDLSNFIQCNGILSEQDRIGISVKGEVQDRVPGILFEHAVFQVLDKLFPYRTISVYVPDIKTILEIIKR